MAGDGVPGKALGWRTNWWVREWMDASGCGDMYPRDGRVRGEVRGEGRGRERRGGEKREGRGGEGGEGGRGGEGRGGRGEEGGGGRGEGDGDRVASALASAGTDMACHSRQRRRRADWGL